MTNSKSTKRALLLSALSLLMCVAMLVGTTFAWFTDTASTAVNKIQAGTLDVDLEVATAYEVVIRDDGSIGLSNIDNWVSAEGKTLDFVKAAGHENEEILWEPGCTYVLPPLRVVNNGNLALKFKVAITGIKGDAKLNEAIDWTMPTTYTNDSYATLQPGASAAFKIAGHMKEDAGNEYMGLSIEGVAITVYATQAASEYDSTNNTYDINAPLPSIWNGTIGTVPAADEDGVITISNAAQFAGFAASVNEFDSYSGMTVVLDTDIDLNNLAWTPIGMVTPTQNNPYFRGTFDGQGHTIYNLTVDKTDADNELGYTTAGLFGWVDAAGCTIKNLNLDGATVKGNHYTGTLAGYFSGVIENCSVVNSTVVSVAHDEDNDGDKIGGLVGYINLNATVKDSTVGNSTVIGKRDVGGLIGCTYNSTCTVIGNTVSDTTVCYNTANGGEVVGRPNGCDVSDNTCNNVTVKANMTSYVGGNVDIAADEKVAYVADATVTVANGEGNWHRIYSDDATFVNCIFNGDGKHWIGDAATFIDCTFNIVIDNAEPKVGTISFENCTFNKSVHFASADGNNTPSGKFFEAENCEFNENLTVSNFEKVTITGCAFTGNNWAGKNMISYCPLVIDNCTFTTGIRLSYSDTSKVTCTNGTVDLSWAGGSATVGSH